MFLELRSEPEGLQRSRWNCCYSFPLCDHGCKRDDHVLPDDPGSGISWHGSVDGLFNCEHLLFIVNYLGQNFFVFGTLADLRTSISEAVAGLQQAATRVAGVLSSMLARIAGRDLVLAA